MPVVINEFQVITEAPAPEAASPSAASPSAPSSPSPHDIGNVIRRDRQRRARVRAH